MVYIARIKTTLKAAPRRVRVARLGRPGLRPSPARNQEREVALTPLSPLEREVVALAMRAGQILGLPKSVGAIYGLLYLSPRPLTMEEIMGRLRISLGSASQGLRQLRSFKAVRPVYVPGARREHFEAEDQFRKLIGSFLDDEVATQLNAASERIGDMTKLIDRAPVADRAWLRQRLEKLENINANARRLLTLVARFLT
jgi:DNA-binding transcriptional regulator GbsR (MarR family)